MAKQHVSRSTVVESPVAPQEVKLDTFERIARAAEAKRVEREAAIASGKLIKTETGKIIAAPKPKPEAKTKVEKPKPLCGCGCGERTGGGTYRPGHDAKHKSALFVLAKAGDEAAVETLEAKGWLHLMALPKVKDSAPKATKQGKWNDDSAWVAALDGGMEGLTV